MPQDELWATSARLTGYSFTFMYAGPSNEQDLLAVRTLWSKQPAEAVRGNGVFDVPTYARGYIPEVFSAVHVELTGGLARNVPGVVRAQLRDVRAGFGQGALH